MDNFDVRASMLSAYSDCSLRAAVSQYPKLFEEHGYKPVWKPKHIAAGVGTGTHTAIQSMLTEKIHTGALGSFDEAMDRAGKKLDEETANGYVADVTTPSKGTAKDQIVRITRTWAGLIGYKTEPVHVEKQLKCNMPHNPGWTLSGRFDYMDRVGPRFRLPDVKTGRAGALYLPQTGLYSILSRSNGIPADEVGTITISRTKLDQNPSEPITQWYPLEAAERSAVATAKMIVRDVSNFTKTGDIYVFPMNPTSWLCSSKSCPAFDFCPMGRAKAAIKNEE